MQMGPDNTHTRDTHNPTIIPNPENGLGKLIETPRRTPRPQSGGKGANFAR